MNKLKYKSKYKDYTGRYVVLTREEAAFAIVQQRVSNRVGGILIPLTHGVHYLWPEVMLCVVKSCRSAAGAELRIIYPKVIGNRMVSGAKVVTVIPSRIQLVPLDQEDATIAMWELAHE